MTVDIPGRNGITVVQLAVGGGVFFLLPQSRYMTDAEIVSIDEETQVVHVKGDGLEGTVPRSAIKNALSPVEYTAHTIAKAQALAP